MIGLCFETSTDVCSVAVFDDTQILAYHRSDQLFDHGAMLSPIIQRCIHDAGLTMKDIEVVGIASGPGSYTALRVGAATAKGMCMGLSIPLIAIDSLEIIADAMIQECDMPDAMIVPMIDARRNEVYTTIYDRNKNIINAQSALILSSDTFQSYQMPIYIGGDGSIKAKAILEGYDLHYSTIIESTALQMIPLVKYKFTAHELEDVRMFSPNYFKKVNITQSTKKLF